MMQRKMVKSREKLESIELQPVLDIPDCKAPENMASVKILSAILMKMILLLL